MRFQILLLILHAFICTAYTQNVPPELSNIPKHELELYLTAKGYSLDKASYADTLEFFYSTWNDSYAQRQMMPEFTHDSAYYWNWDLVSNAWVFSRKSIFYRDETLNNLITYQYKWNGSEWESEYRYTTTYGLPGNQTTVTEDWDGNEFVNYSKFILTNDTVKRETTSTNQRWQSNQWVNQFSTRITMNTHDQIIHIISVLWNGSAWVNSRQLFYTYDTAQVLQAIETHDWDNNAWSLFSNAVYEYDTNEVVSTLFLWEDPIGLVTHSRQFSTYDSLGNLLIWSSQDAEEGQWIDTWRRFFEYNSDGNEILNREERYSDSEGWQNSDRTLTSYLTPELRQYIVRQVWDTAWIGNDSTHHYYSEIITGADQQKDEWGYFRIYPNPASGEVSFVTSPDVNEPLLLRVYSTTGLLVLERKELDKTESLDVSSIPAGLYFIQIMNGNDQVVRRLVKI